MPRAVSLRMISKRRSTSRGVSVAGRLVEDERALRPVRSALAISTICIWAMPSSSTGVSGRHLEADLVEQRRRARRRSSPTVHEPGRAGRCSKERFSSMVRYVSRLNSW